ncbi:MAG: flavin reductase family protein [Alphaproteobacteria bacterium]|nr:flavin reductase family protein [Alphaproteobacteria bacterium]
MAKISWKPGTMLAPIPPALISCGTMDNPNVMTAAWTGVICTEPTLVYVSIRPSRFSHQLIRQNSEFVINVPTVKLARAVDMCGVKSGRNTDKFALTGLTPQKCVKISAPQVAEAPISLECVVKNVTSYGSHDMFLAEVVAVNVDEDLLDKQNALMLDKAGLLAYAHGFYYALGKKIGKFGWSVEKKSTKRKRLMRQSEKPKAEAKAVKQRVKKKEK